MHRQTAGLLALGILADQAMPAWAQVKPIGLFQGNMVLHRGVKLPL